MSAARDDRRAALEAEVTEWAHEEERWAREQERGEQTSGAQVVERLTALLIRARDAGLSDGEIAEMLNRAHAEAQAEDAEPSGGGWTAQDVMEWMREHETHQAWTRDQDVMELMRDHEGDEGREVEFQGSAIWGGATLGLVVGLILGFFIAGSYWRNVLIAVLIGAGAGIAANVLAWVGDVIARRGRAGR